MNVRHFFESLVEKGGSDLYLRADAKPRARIDGEVHLLQDKVISEQEIHAIANMLLAQDHRKKKFDEVLDIDFIHNEKGLGRFRVNIFMQRGTPSIVARHVLSHMRSFEELHLPADVCKKFCEEAKGLFLVTGPAGNGKSTTIATMLDYINSQVSKHIITIEDPVEFLFDDKKSLISQRELGFDVHSYPQALKHVTQQSPDIIYIGNIRDNETMKAAITATELGCFVMTTFHTINAVQTIIRIINFFPPYLHDEVRMQLSIILKGTMSLRLLPRKDGKGRVPAYEVMFVTPTIASLIREGKIREIQKYIEEGNIVGMQSFKTSLVRLVKDGIVDADEARKYADSKDDFELELKGIKRYSD